MARILSLLGALALGGCSLGSLSDATVDVPIAPIATYQELVAKGALVATLRAKPALAPLEISGLRKAMAPQPGEWLTCLHTSDEGRPLYYAIFFKDGAIQDARLNVSIDHCDQEQFSPLAGATPPPSPPPPATPK